MNKINYYGFLTPHLPNDLALLVIEYTRKVTVTMDEFEAMQKAYLAEKTAAEKEELSHDLPALQLTLYESVPSILKNLLLQIIVPQINPKRIDPLFKIKPWVRFTDSVARICIELSTKQLTHALKEIKETDPPISATQLSKATENLSPSMRDACLKLSPTLMIKIKNNESLNIEELADIQGRIGTLIAQQNQLLDDASHSEQVDVELYHS